MERENIEERKTRSAATMLFLIGLFSQTQISIGGKLGISELAMVVFAPFALTKGIHAIRKDGSLYYFSLIILWLAGAIAVDIYTHNYFQFTLRGLAVPITLFCNSVCIYLLLRRKYDNLRWLLVGLAISEVISIFVFQRGGAGDVASEFGFEAGVERVVGYKLFWVNMLTTWLTLPIRGWYMNVPKLYSILAISFLAAFNLATGGRSAFLVVAVSLLLIMFAGKTRESLTIFKRHIVTIVVLLCFLGVVAKITYKYAATHGYMGEEEARKYEQSTEHGSGALDLIIAGRGEFFIGAMAALDKPIMGHGSVAIDDHGYVLDFLSKYGDQEIYERIVKMRRDFGARVIPAHSHIITYWMWHGIWGLIFWLVVIVLAIKTLFTRMHVYPPWFGYFAIAIPMFFWDVLFSPFGSRVHEATLFVAFLLVSKLRNNQKHALDTL